MAKARKPDPYARAQITVYVVNREDANYLRPSGTRASHSIKVPLGTTALQLFTQEFFNQKYNQWQVQLRGLNCEPGHVMQDKEELTVAFDIRCSPFWSGEDKE